MCWSAIALLAALLCFSGPVRGQKNLGSPTARVLLSVPIKPAVLQQSPAIVSSLRKGDIELQSPNKRTWTCIKGTTSILHELLSHLSPLLPYKDPFGEFVSQFYYAHERPGDAQAEAWNRVDAIRDMRAQMHDAGQKWQPRVVDLGAGNGKTALRLAELDWNVHIVEINANGIATMLEQKLAHPENLSFYLAPMQWVTFPPASSFLTRIRATSYYLRKADWARIMANVSSSLIKGGYLDVDFMPKDDPWTKVNQRVTGGRFVAYSDRDIKRMMSGFSPVVTKVNPHKMTVTLRNQDGTITKDQDISGLLVRKILQRN